MMRGTAGHSGRRAGAALAGQTGPYAQARAHFEAEEQSSWLTRLLARLRPEGLGAGV